MYAKNIFYQIVLVVGIFIVYQSTAFILYIICFMLYFLLCRRVQSRPHHDGANAIPTTDGVVGAEVPLLLGTGLGSRIVIGSIRPWGQPHGDQISRTSGKGCMGPYVRVKQLHAGQYGLYMLNKESLRNRHWQVLALML